MAAFKFTLDFKGSKLSSDLYAADEDEAREKIGAAWPDWSIDELELVEE